MTTLRVAAEQQTSSCGHCIGHFVGVFANKKEMSVSGGGVFIWILGGGGEIQHERTPLI